MEKVQPGMKEFGSIIGYLKSDYEGTLNFSDVYYLKDASDFAVGNVKDNEYGATKIENIKNEEIVNVFNNYINSENKVDWKKWKIGEKGYPEINL